MKQISHIKIFYHKYQYALINAFKASIASLIGYLTGHYLGNSLGISQMYGWIVVTILVVMSSQPNLGGAIDKALMRFIVTTIAATIAIIIIFFMHHYQLIQLIMSLCLILIGVFIANSIPKYTYAGVLGAITIAITMFGQEVTVSFAFFRALEVLIGIVIALIVNRFLLPIRAEKQIEKSFSETIDEIRNLLQLILKGGEYDTSLEKVFNHFSKQIALVKEIRYEKARVYLEDYKKINHSIRKLYRHLRVVYEYIETYPNKRACYQKHEQFLLFYQEIDELLLLLSKSFYEKKVICHDKLTHIKVTLNDFTSSFQMDEKFRYSNTLVFSLSTVILSIESIMIHQKNIYQISKS